jgi:hypothetical protein
VGIWIPGCGSDLIVTAFTGHRRPYADLDIAGRYISPLQARRLFFLLIHVSISDRRAL